MLTIIFWIIVISIIFECVSPGTKAPKYDMSIPEQKLTPIENMHRAMDAEINSK